MNKLLIICGPTATGKTALGLKIAKQFNGEIISADSRQVYKGMDIGTGKDLPKNVKWQNSNVKWSGKKVGFHTVNDTKMWGYDVVKPHESFNVSHYIEITRNILGSVWNRGKLPIVVGGTGLYIDSLLNPPETATVKPNRLLRKKLVNYPINKLQHILEELNPTRFNQMNSSDQNNPRRLVRAIEIARAGKTKINNHQKIKPLQAETLWIGLTLPRATLNQQIKQRVGERLSQGMEKEVESLTRLYPDWKYPALSATGYQEVRAHLSRKMTKQEAAKTWVMREQQYARRQITWFKKNPNIYWLPADSPALEKTVVEMVKNWYL